MKNDLRIGLAIWRKITNRNFAFAQFFFFLISGLLTVTYLNPRFIERINTVFSADANKILLALTILHTLISCIAVEQAIGESYHRNKHLFYQLSLNRRAECICTLLQKIGWYYYFMIVLLAIWNTAILKIRFVFPIASLLFIIGSTLDYYKAEARILDGKPSISYQVHRLFYWKKRTNASAAASQKSGKFCAAFFRKHPFIELMTITIRGFYQYKSLATAKLLLILFLFYCQNIQVLGEKIFLLSTAFLILLNDRYWREESRNFSCFSSIGIPMNKYIFVHFLAGICFNLTVPVLIFLNASGSVKAVILNALLLCCMIFFWYLSQIYLYLKAGQDNSLLTLFGSIILLILGAIPGINVLLTIRIYKQIVTLL